jgi:hypothetical protein
MKNYDKVKTILLGTLLCCALLIFTGAATISGGEVGRYQIEVTRQEDKTVIFVVDTTTGAVKKIINSSGFNTTFDKIK